MAGGCRGHGGGDPSLAVETWVGESLADGGRGLWPGSGGGGRRISLLDYIDHTHGGEVRETELSLNQEN